MHTPKSNVICFYNTNDVLLYKEKVESMKIKTKNAKVCMKLKTAFGQAATVIETGNAEIPIGKFYRNRVIKLLT